jgi:hypothetical protein
VGFDTPSLPRLLLRIRNLLEIELDDAGVVVAVLGLHVLDDLGPQFAQFGRDKIASGTLTFRTDINTQVVVGNFLVLQGGTLQVGTAAKPIAANVQATIDLGNQPLDGPLIPSSSATA